MAQYVIIGNGVAAAGCIEGIRSMDKVSPITVISGEDHPVYCRPLISYYLEGKTTLDKMNYRKADFYDKNNCRVLYGKKVTAIDPDAKSVSIDDGTAIPYTQLCVAAGSSPFVPPTKGMELVAHKYTFLTLDDTLALEKAISSESRILIVGAGLIGLKCAEGLCGRVKKITICDLATRVLSSILDDECAAIVQAHLEKHGMEFMLGDTAVEFTEHKALMKSGAEVDFDVLVMAVGVRPNVSLIKEIGGDVNRGILIDCRMKTSVEDIYAAGDCTEGDDISFGGKRVLALLPNAYQQGRCAGINMAGGDEIFDKGIPMNSIGFFGLHAMTAGSYFGPDQGGELYEERSDGKLKRLFSRDGYLTGFILIDNIDRAGIYTSLIREKVPLDTINYTLLRESPTFSAFSEEIRRKKFGGVV